MNSKDIYLYTLQNQQGTTVKITNYGAIITSFIIKDKNDQENDIVLGFDDISSYWAPEYLAKHPWFGCAVGRYANRIKDAKFELDGKVYQLTRTPGQGNEQLHGGIDGFDKKFWTFINSGNDPHPFLELSYLSVDGEEGFPGDLETIIKYELSNDNVLSYEYTAVCDKPTPVNLTQHSYFNLNNGDGTIHDHDLRIPASERLEQVGNLVASGNYVPVEDTAYDFRKFKRIGDGLESVDEFDSSYVIDRNNDKTLQLVAETKSKQSGLLLQLHSTEPVVHFYSGKWIPPVTGKRGIHYKPFSGFCLETHNHPNAVNVPHFPNTILRPGERYYQRTEYHLHLEK